jgi:DNA-binding LytR/AlgR family response regulator
MKCIFLLIKQENVFFSHLCYNNFTTMRVEGEMMKIVVCDDNEQERKQIVHMVKEYFEARRSEEKNEVIDVGNSMELAEWISNGKRFDIILLDVIMPTLNGIELASEIRNFDTSVKIIFLTASAEFAVKSYSVQAFHYLLKPIQTNELYSVLENACFDICNSLKEFILVSTQNEHRKVFFSTLLYIEVVGRKIYLNQLSGAVVQSYGLISKIEETLLKDKRFIKPHRSYIVNMDYVKTLTKDGFITISNQFVPVSRNVYKKVKQTFFEYLS